jgi:hypothetical protein
VVASEGSEIRTAGGGCLMAIKRASSYRPRAVLHPRFKGLSGLS